MTITDQQLSAYLDGELPADEHARIAKALAEQPELVRRLERLGRVGRAVSETFAGIDQKPMPQAVLDLLKPPAPDAKASDTGWWAELMYSLRPWMPVAGMAMALMAGLLIGARFGWLAPPDNGYPLQAAAIIQPGDSLYALLENTPSGVSVQLEGASAAPVLTFRTTAGQFCREFRSSGQTTGMHAVACREHDGWRVQVVGFHDTAVTGTDYYLTASGEDSAGIGAFIDRHRQGDALGADQEHTLMSAGWQP